MFAILVASRQKRAGIDIDMSMHAMLEVWNTFTMDIRDGYERESGFDASSAIMTGHILKDDYVTCIDTKMKLVLMNRARLIKYMRRVDTDGVT